MLVIFYQCTSVRVYSLIFRNFPTLLSFFVDFADVQSTSCRWYHSPNHLLLIVLFKHPPRRCGASGAALAHERMAVLAKRSETENSTDFLGPLFGKKPLQMGAVFAFSTGIWFRMATKHWKIFCFFGHLVRCPAMPSARLGQGRRCERKHCFGMCQKPFCLCASFLGWTSTYHLLWCVQKGGRVLTHTHLAENYIIYNYGTEPKSWYINTCFWHFIFFLEP